MSTAALLACLAAGAVAEVWNHPPYRRWPLLTLGIALLVGTTFALQSLAPELQPLFARDPRMLSSGEVWRAMTALFVQDGGLNGTLFNLFWLLLLGTTAERRFTRRAWLAVYFGGGIVTEFLALAWQPHGAGNSIACLALAGALCSDWREGRWRWWRAGVGLAGAVAAFLLLLESDIHGIGFFAGLVIGFAIHAATAPSRRGTGPADENSNVVVFMNGTDTYH